ncbi:MAG: CYTH domain-containing protein, partial [Patescibacteria group bacterium]
PADPGGEMAKEQMNIEYEATFIPVDKDDIRTRLKNAGALLIRPEFTQRRTVLNLPQGHEIPGAWLRVRDEGDKNTMSLKVIDGEKITDQKETCIIVSDYDETIKLMEAIGCQPKAYQESKRELWTLDGVEITLDEWPFLEPFVEVEGKSEYEVRSVSEKIGFNWQYAKFCAVGRLYGEKYNIPTTVIDNETPRIVFGEKNPFTKE